MMEFKRHLQSVVLITVFLAAFAWVVLRPHEPLYQGRPLRAWLEMAPQNGWYIDPGSARQVQFGNRDLATSLLPIVVQLAGTRRTVPRMILGDMARDEGFSFLHLPPQNGKYELATWVCRVLGPEARSAVPGLVPLLRDKDPWVRMEAARCLAAIGPTAEEAVPALITAWAQATNQNLWVDNNVRAFVAEALGEMGPAAQAALPYLQAETNELFQLMVLKIKGESFAPFLDRLKDTSDLRRWSRTASVVGRLGTNASAAVPLFLSVLSQTNRTIPQSNLTIYEQTLEALGQIHSQPELCVPAILTLLGSSNLNVRAKSLWALRGFGPAAKPAVPQLVRALQDHDHWFKREATNTLREIDPEAAALAGINTNQP